MRLSRPGDGYVANGARIAAVVRGFGARTAARRMTPCVRAAVCSLSIGCLTDAALAQRPAQYGAITGNVVSAVGIALVGVHVGILGTPLTELTREDGRFDFSRLAASRYRLVARRPGYKPDTMEVSVAGGDTLALWFELASIVPVLTEVSVRATFVAPRLVGFEERRARSVGGRFVTALEIRAQAPTETSDVLRRVMGVRIADSMHVMVPVSNRGNKIVRIGNRLVSVPCVMRLGLNGFLQDPSFAMNSVPPADIHGIEIYNGPSSIPAQFNGTATDLYCGLIMLWTKSGDASLPS